ncbi:MAG: Ig-like domain-containing protein [Ferrovum sp.]|nr:Ig-like domain-containing protein [Ferrovum sp.]NDU86566.1 Ig-like domain-containing protein [Ferrovum sp.]
MAFLLSALAAGCGGGGGGRAPILGIGNIVAHPPTVSAVAPVNNATGVPINNTLITAAFSEPMLPLTGAATFSLACAAPCANPTGTVVLDATNRIATFTSATNLTPLTLYTGTITGARSLATGLAMAFPYVWSFTTGLAADTTRPTITLTKPVTSIPGPTTNIPTNTAITAIFSEDMAPLTIGSPSFTVTGPGSTPVTGVVTYVIGSRTAVFTPTNVLTAGTTYTATITTAATDLSGNTLAGNQGPLLSASNYVWTFDTTASPIPATNITVLSTSPVSGATGLCPGLTINATFNPPVGVRMDPLTINSANFTVSGPAPTLTPVVAASVVLDTATGTIATFTPLTTLAPGITYTATIIGGPNGVKDLAIPADTMTNNYTWNFTTGTSGSCVTILLSMISYFDGFSGGGDHFG